MPKVLLIEDNIEVADSLIRAIETRGFEVINASTVASAQAAYEVDRFDFMIIDYELPDGTGLDFLAGIRGSDKAVTILYSGLPRDRELRATGLTVDHQISKSEPHALLDVLEGKARKIRTEDGVEVGEGDRVYGFHSQMTVGTIVLGSMGSEKRKDEHHNREMQGSVMPWFTVEFDNGKRELLNGQRVCSVEYATRKGWVK